MKVRMRAGALLAALVLSILLLAACGSGDEDGVSADPAGMHMLNVTVEGAGIVHIDAFDWSCSDDCTLPVGDGVELTLEASGTNGADFAGWGGACDGSSACTVEMTGDATVNANFGEPAAPGESDGNALSLDIRGDGEGSVRIVPPDVVCSDDCTQTYDSEVAVSLSVTLQPGSEVRGWSGPCEAAGSEPYCTFTVSNSADVEVEIGRVMHALSVAVSGAGSVVVEPGDHSCGDECSYSFAEGESLTLTARPRTGSRFIGWEGCSNADGNECRLTVSGDDSVRARFAPTNHNLTVRIEGYGSVSRNPQGENCGTACDRYEYATTVELTASRALPWIRFAGWSGACEGERGNVCIVRMTDDLEVTARFR